MITKELKFQLLYFFLLGVGINLTNTAFFKWREITPQKEGAVIVADLLCIGIMYILWSKYIRSKERLTVEEKLMGAIPMLAGILVGVGLTHLF